MRIREKAWFRFAGAASLLTVAVCFSVWYLNWPQRRDAPYEGPPPERVFRFPRDVWYGTLYVREWGAGDDAERETVGAISGKVVVPAGKEINLAVHGRLPRTHFWTPFLHKLGIRMDSDPPPCDLSLLKKFGPYDVKTLMLPLNIDDKTMRNVGRLKGLESLWLWSPSSRRTRYIPQITDRGYAHLAGLTNLRHLSLPWCNIPDSSLKYFRDMTLIEELDLSWGSVKGPGLIHLAGWPRLRKLELPGSIEPGGLRPLRAFPSLEELHLGFAAGQGSADFADIAEVQSLRVLSLRLSRIDGTGLELLARLPLLEEMTLEWRRATDEGLAHLEPLDALKELRITSNHMTDAGLAHIGRLKSLKKLYIKSDTINGSGFGHLGGLESIESIDFWMDNLTDEVVLDELPRLKNLKKFEIMYPAAAIEREETLSLMQRMPRCKFTWSGRH